MQGISSPLAGRLADRFGARSVILLSSIIFALLLVSSQVVSEKLWNLYVFCGLLGFVGSGPAPRPSPPEDAEAVLGAQTLVETGFVGAIMSPAALSTTILGSENLRSLIKFVLQLPL